jgi:hypothetical protein
MINAANYEQMRAWFAIVSGKILGPFAPETDPIADLDQMAAKSPSTARQGLAMAVDDMIEMTSNWSESQVAALDEKLSAERLPTLSEIRTKFSKTVRGVVRRGVIKNDVEYYAVRNAAELTSDADQFWQLLAEYEARVANGP